MPEEKPPDHIAGARLDRHGEIASYLQMPFWHAMVGMVLPIARIDENIVRPDYALTLEGGYKHLSCAGHADFQTATALRPIACKEDASPLLALS